MERNMEEYWYWLCSQKELYRNHIAKLMNYFITPQNLYEASAAEIEKIPYLNKNQKMVLIQNRMLWDIRENYHNRKKQGIEFISAEHPSFPRRIKQISDPPFGLFYKGNLPKEDTFSAAIVGARRCSGYGKRSAEMIARALAGSGVQIISGLAAGIDGFAQAAAVEAGGSSYSVLGCGADICYPEKNKGLYERVQEKGGILTEYPPGREPLAMHFPMRNRIISGLSDIVIVIEAKEKSGSLITADCALDQGRDVYALPGRIEEELSRGCNYLIAQGAGIIVGVDEFLKELQLPAAGNEKNIKNNITLETIENLVYSCLDFNSKSLQTILQETNLQIQVVAGVLLTLELKGVIKESAKNYYEKIR